MCRQHLVEMQSEHEALEARGVQLVAVGQGTGEEAARLCASLAVSYPCLGDPGKAAYRAFGLPRGGWRQILLDPILDGNKAIRAGHRVSMTGSLMRHSDWFQLPGVAVIDRDGVVRYLHRARHSGDIPPPTAVLEAVDALTRR